MSAAVLQASDGVRITVYPSQVIVNGSVRLRCTVPRDAEHRWLDMGIEDYRTSGRPLEGEGAPITHEMLIEHVPCIGVAVTAFCVVTNATRKPERAVFMLNVGGCEDSGFPSDERAARP